MSYNPKILEYASKREHFGALDELEQDVGVGYVGNAACGDMLKVYLQVENNIIINVKVKSYGCGCAIASTALAAEKLKGRTLQEAALLTDKEIADELQLPGIKKHCSVLAHAAVKKALENYTDKQADGVYEMDIAKTALTNMHTGCCKTEENVKTECCKTEEAVKTGCCKTEEIMKTGCCKTEENVKTECCKAEDTVKTKVTAQTQSSMQSSAKPFNITLAAKQRFEEIIKMHENAKGIKIFSEAGGCAGNAYNIDIVFDEVDENDMQYSIESVNFVIPKNSLMFILGITIDYIVTDTQAGFQFINPSAKSCGCGSSFR